jgi:hypothetical protein
MADRQRPFILSEIAERPELELERDGERPFLN